MNRDQTAMVILLLVILRPPKEAEKTVNAFFYTCGGKSHAVGMPLQSGFAFNHLSSAIIFPLIKIQMVQIGFCYKECPEILAVMTFMDMEICFI